MCARCKVEHMHNAQENAHTMSYDIAEVNRLSGTTEAQRTDNFRWLARQGEQTRIEAVKLQTDLIRQYRHEHRNQQSTSEFTYSMHALAVCKMVWLETAQKHKGARLSGPEFEHVQEVRIGRIKAKKQRKSSPKKELIRVRFYTLIKTLRDMNLSWREIADYLSVHHKTRLAHSYIRESFNALTLEQQKAGVP